MSIQISRTIYSADSPSNGELLSASIVYQTSEWIDFIADTKNAEPVILEIRENGNLIGVFTGLIFRIFGMKIFGSPFPGWTTMYMGFNRLESQDIGRVVRAIVDYVFKDLRCVHFEMIDRRLRRDVYSGCEGEIFEQESMEIDLTLSEEKLFSNMSSKSCRYSIRKAEKCGVKIIEVSDEAFVDDYYSQLCDVFKKQNLVPTYGKDRVAKLIKHIYPTGNLLLLRALDKEGLCIATGIFPSFKDVMFFWGGASWRDAQHLCPNEALIWYAMRYWKNRGVKIFDMGGGIGYKKKYGGYTIAIPGLRESKYGMLAYGRNVGKAMFSLMQRINGYLSKMR